MPLSLLACVNQKPRSGGGQGWDRNSELESELILTERSSKKTRRVQAADRQHWVHPHCDRSALPLPRLFIPNH